MTGFLRRLFGGQNRTPEQTPELAIGPVSSGGAPRFNKNAEEPLSLSAEAQVEVLNQFRNGVDPEKVPPEAWQDFWTHKLGVPFRQAAKALFAEGLLCEASPKGKLAASRNLSELKALAKKMEIKVSGRKDELAARLVENAGPDLLEELTKKNVWVCSDAAQKIVDEHRELKKNRLHEVRLETLDLLKRKRLKEACELVGEYEQAQFYPRGIGADWTGADKRMYQKLKVVYAAQPKFHKRRLGEVSSEIRERAAMSVLWGTSAFGDLFSRAELPEQAEQVELFSRMLDFHSSYLCDLEQMKELAHRISDLTCEIVGADDQNTACDACKSDNGKIYRLDDVPELPHEKCECAIGCRCFVVAKFPDDY